MQSADREARLADFVHWRSACTSRTRTDIPKTKGIPLRPFGHHGDKISALGFGGHDLGDAEDEQTVVRLIHEGIDGGINFFDSGWEYHRGCLYGRVAPPRHCRKRRNPGRCAMSVSRGPRTRRFI
jgi:hypothetical protein